MKWERRKKPAAAAPKVADLSTDLPVDYLRLIESTLTAAVEKGLIEMRKIHPTSVFQAHGAIFGDEVILAATLFHGEKALAATTVYSSADYDPNADKPGLEATLAACLEAIGSIFDFYLDVKHPERITQMADRSIGSIEDAPFEWTAVSYEIEEQLPVWVKMDKANPFLETLTDRWLLENDPNFKNKTPEELAEAEEFLEERLEAIQKAKTGGSMGGSGPITH